MEEIHPLLKGLGGGKRFFCPPCGEPSFSYSLKLINGPNCWQQCRQRVLLRLFAGARNADLATGNAVAGTLALPEQELVEIDEIGRGVTDYLDDDPVMWNF